MLWCLQIERTYDPDDIIPASERISRAAVIAYVAKYYSGLPFQVRRQVSFSRFFPLGLLWC